jgi:opacity protein-like surface antigen
MRSGLISGIAAVAFVLMGMPTSAQTGDPFRGFVSINGGYQASSTDFRDSVVFTEFVEQGSVDSSYTVKSGPQLDISGGARVWRSLGIGVGVTRFSKSGAVSVAGKIPHPFFFNQARSVEGEAGGLTREELAVHIQAMAIVPGGERLSLAVFAGPSFFDVKQAIVQRLQYSQQYPYDTATFSGVETDTPSESTIGFNAGADVGYFFSRNVGIGGVIRFTRASVDFTSIDGQTVSVDAGGVQAGAGLRLRF